MSRRFVLAGRRHIKAAMALSAALARAATRLLRGSVPPAGSAAAVSPLSYRSHRQLCGTPTADKPSAAGPWDEAEAEILRDVEPVVDLVKDIIHSRRSASVSSIYCWLSSPQDLQDDT